MSEILVGVMEGDYIGPKITDIAMSTIQKAGEIAGLDIGFKRIPASGAAYDLTGEHLPASSVEAALFTGALLKGPFGGPPNSPDPKWQGLEQKAILPLREQLGVYANLRPIKVLGEVGVHLSPLKNEIAEGIDLMVVRELTGDIYFGDSDHGFDPETEENWAYEEGRYTDTQVERIIRAAVKVARERNDKLTWIHKTNVLEETGGLWRDVFNKIMAEEDGLETGYIHVDAAAAALLGKLKTGTVVTTNMFGDILSDEGAMLTGSLGLGASASLRTDDFGLYEPIHGSAPDLNDAEDANPIGMILSAALMFRHSLGQPEAADLIERSVAGTLDELYLPADLYAMSGGSIEGVVAKQATASEFGNHVQAKMQEAA